MTSKNTAPVAQDTKLAAKLLGMGKIRLRDPRSGKIMVGTIKVSGLCDEPVESVHLPFAGERMVTIGALLVTICGEVRVAVLAATQGGLTGRWTVRCDLLA